MSEPTPENTDQPVEDTDTPDIDAAEAAENLADTPEADTADEPESAEETGQ
jgi:hypothetical protein